MNRPTVGNESLSTQPSQLTQLHYFFAKRDFTSFIQLLSKIQDLNSESLEGDEKDLFEMLMINFVGVLLFEMNDQQVLQFTDSEVGLKLIEMAIQSTTTETIDYSKAVQERVSLARVRTTN